MGEIVDLNKNTVNMVKVLKFYENKLNGILQGSMPSRQRRRIAVFSATALVNTKITTALPVPIMDKYHFQDPNAPLYIRLIPINLDYRYGKW